MADKRLDQTTNASAVAAADNIPFVTAAGVTSYVTGDELAASGPFSSRYRAIADEKLWVHSQNMTPVSGSPAMGTLGNASGAYARAAAMLFDAANVEYVAFSVLYPSSWSTFNLYLHWSNAGAGTGDVSWYGTFLSAGDGETTDGGALLNSGSTLLVAAPAQYIVKRTLLTDSPRSCTGGELLKIVLGRFASDAGDTLANDAGLLGVEIVRAS